MGKWGGSGGGVGCGGGGGVIRSTQSHHEKVQQRRGTGDRTIVTACTGHLVRGLLKLGAVDINRWGSTQSDHDVTRSSFNKQISGTQSDYQRIVTLWYRPEFLTRVAVSGSGVLMSSYLVQCLKRICPSNCFNLGVICDALKSM